MKLRKHLLITSALLLLLLLCVACANPTEMESDAPPAAEALEATSAESETVHQYVEQETVPSLKKRFFGELNLNPPEKEETTEPIKYGPVYASADEVPQEDRSDILGRTYTIRLTPDEGGIGFMHYCSNSAEKLTVYLRSPDGYDLILTFLTQFGNTADFREAVRSGEYFPARLVHCANAEMAFPIYYLAGRQSVEKLGEPYAHAVFLTAGWSNTQDQLRGEKPTLIFCFPDTADVYAQQYFDFLKDFGIFIPM